MSFIKKSQYILWTIVALFLKKCRGLYRPPSLGHVNPSWSKPFALNNIVWRGIESLLY